MREKVKKLTREEKAERLARRMSIFVVLMMTAELVFCCLSFCERIQGDLASTMTIVCAIFGICAIVADILHEVVFPRCIKGYPHYEKTYDEVTDSTTEVGKAAKLFTKKRVIFNAIAIGLSMIFTVGMNILWPLGSVPEEMPTVVGYVEDSNRLVAEDFGCIAVIEPDVDGKVDLRVCTSVEAYGPFQYDVAPREQETVIKHTARNAATDLAFGGGDYMRGSSETLYVKFNHYEDGYWMIVKRFNDYSSTIMSDTEEVELRLISVMNMLYRDEIPYKVYKIGSGANAAKTLDDATYGVFRFELRLVNNE